MTPAALLEAMQRAGAVFRTGPPDAVAAHYGDAVAEYHAVRNRCGLLLRTDRAVLSVRGADGISWLQGLVSNDVTLLQRGARSVAACLLNATGHVLADLVIARYTDRLLIDTPRTASSVALSTLDRVIIMEDVVLEDESAEWICMGIQGPAATEDDVRDAAGPGACVVPADATGAGGFAAYVAAGDSAAAWTALVEAGSQPIGHEAAEALRIEAGIPRFGEDMDETTIPLEAGLGSTHISYQKGCYVGQEIVARIQSRGHTNRALTGLLIESTALPPHRASVTDPADAGRLVGSVTSAAISPAHGRAVALGYLRNEVREPGRTVGIGFAGGPVPATVVPLPFPGAAE